MIAGADYLPDDCVDQGHLMISGGGKLAVQLAEEVRRAADERAYQPHSEAIR